VKSQKVVFVNFLKYTIVKKIILLCFLLIGVTSYSQTINTTKVEPWKKIYRASATKINDLVHTKLDVKFDYTKAWMNGKAWITLHPHFYATDSLSLDAKAMNINEVAMVKGGKNIPLKYTYDSTSLRITLDKMYKANENYTIYIDYVSKPNDHVWPKSDSKGLYFINSTGKEKDKPTQIWTFGEPEHNSSWYPTIDKPNQKTTDEIILTFHSKYVTLSNGLLVNQKNNGNGTRTDTWKMDLPFAPYLLFFAVGNYSIVKDSYKGKEVSYYVEKEYAPVARKIFGLTPEMIAFFSKITGVDYPWPKYAQIVGRDFVAGAEENVSATLHAEGAQQDARQLVDGNNWESTIAHELFHHWFGDLVTCESWSNITLNESFANYSETLWFEHKYGKDEGDAWNYRAMKTYLDNSADTAKNLVRFYYNDPQDVFDNISYPKGGRILGMLRNYVGDSAFFKSLNLYLTNNKFKSAEAQNLRLAFEEITGKD
jgi:aminopeptidase N